MRPILFDVDGVLIHGMHAKRERQRRWDQHLEADLGINHEEFYTHFIREVFIPQVITGHKALISALEETLPRLGYKGSPMTVAAYWLSRDSHLNHPLLERIKALKSSGAAKMFIATNQEHLRAQYLWATLGLQHLFDDMFYSARLGAAKPDARFFEAVEARLKGGAETPLLIDDSAEVVDAAIARGWDAITYDSVDDFVHHPWVGAHLA